MGDACGSHLNTTPFTIELLAYIPVCNENLALSRDLGVAQNLPELGPTAGSLLFHLPFGAFSWDSTV